MSSNDGIATPRSVPTQLSSHDRILKSAKQLFARSGYENTSTVAIARQAGTSESQLMKHFGSKQGLLSAILDRGWVAIADRLMPRVARCLQEKSCSPFWRQLLSNWKTMRS